ncbi:Fusaric acid resistance protein family protein [Sodalis glossinidius str. 'morsitans']|uniref:Fusaric acid resistance protein family protein n=1 Tax=Sodalis glossinidius (strain morsitans) TaxID=343509 RepID=A0A193QNB2_SODGM|nr:FUSC family protein [Sodalis glossinidius]CRL46405.1 Fusaric acid resistance protein family protein [Sodalis glossinidius str. 'morsitans']
MVEEICLGILCATLVHSVVLPAGLSASVMGLMDKTLTDIFADAAPPPPDEEDALSTARVRLSLDITQLRLLATHIPFDTGNLRWTAATVRTLQDRVALLLPTLSAVDDRLQALYQAEDGCATVAVRRRRHAPFA